MSFGGAVARTQGMVVMHGVACNQLEPTRKRRATPSGNHDVLQRDTTREVSCRQSTEETGTNDIYIILYYRTAFGAKQSPLPSSCSPKFLPRRYPGLLESQIAFICDKTAGDPGILRYCTSAHTKASKTRACVLCVLCVCARACVRACVRVSEGRGGAARCGAVTVRAASLADPYLVHKAP